MLVHQCQLLARQWSGLVQQVGGDPDFPDVVQQRGILELAQSEAFQAKELCDGHGKRGGSAGVGVHESVFAEDHGRQRPQRRHEAVLDLPPAILGLAFLAADVPQHPGLRVHDQPNDADQHQQGALIERCPAGHQGDRGRHGREQTDRHRGSKRQQGGGEDGQHDVEGHEIAGVHLAGDAQVEEWHGDANDDGSQQVVHGNPDAWQSPAQDPQHEAHGRGSPGGE